MPQAHNHVGARPAPRFFRAAAPDRLEQLPPRLVGGALGACVRLAARPLSARHFEAMARGGAEIAGRDGLAWRLLSDEVDDADRSADAPSARALLLAGLAASVADELIALAADRDVDLGPFELVQDLDDPGPAAGDWGGEPRSLPLELRFAGDLRLDLARSLLLDAAVASPINGLLRRAQPNLFSLSLGGRSIPLDGVAALAPEPPLDAAPIAPATGDWGSLLDARFDDAAVQIAATPPRRLRCRTEPDGLKRITVDRRTPRGGAFDLLSDTPPSAGGLGRAPDPLSLVAAGLGASLLREIGRAARTQDRRIGSFSILQDLHLSQGGATGRTGRAGAAAPVETHLHFGAALDDDVARAVLRQAEQACPLQTMCRSSVRLHLRAARLAADAEMGV